MAFTKLTDAQIERLAKLAEELNEAASQCMKIVRHGYTAVDESTIAPTSYDNKKLLEIELGDVVAAMNMMAKAGDFDMGNVVWNSQDAIHVMRKYMHHQG